MEAVIQLSAELAAALHGAAAGAQQEHVTQMRRALVAELARQGASLSPQHPGTADTELLRYFSLLLPDDTDGNALLVALRGLDGITAAYLKPEAEPA